MSDETPTKKQLSDNEIRSMRDEYHHTGAMWAAFDELLRLRALPREGAVGGMLVPEFSCDDDGALTVEWYLNSTAVLSVACDDGAEFHFAAATGPGTTSRGCWQLGEQPPQSFYDAYRAIAALSQSSEQVVGDDVIAGLHSVNAYLACDANYDDYAKHTPKINAAIAALDTSRERGEVRKPDGYAYRYPSMYGVGTTIIFSGGAERNGSKPIEAVPYYFGTPPATAAAPVEMERDAMRGELAEALLHVAGYRGERDQLQRDHDALLEQVRAAREALEAGAEGVTYLNGKPKDWPREKYAATLRALAVVKK